VALVSGIAAGSLVLIAFGLDSVIELISAGVLMWRLSAELRHGQAGLPPGAPDEQHPILFLSSRDEEVDRVVGLEIGGDDYKSPLFPVPQRRPGASVVYIDPLSAHLMQFQWMPKFLAPGSLDNW